jgi:hypothetical protein
VPANAAGRDFENGPVGSAPSAGPTGVRRKGFAVAANTLEDRDLGDPAK